MKNIMELMERCGLGKVCGEITAVSGGFLHKMFRVPTVSGVYAVKRLNPDIMKRQDAHENFAAAEKLELMLEKNDIPIVAALCINGKKMQELGGEYFYIFGWQEGSITDMGNVTREQCRIAGELLGRIHSIDVRENEAPEAEPNETDLSFYLKKAEERGDKDIYDMLAENMSLLERARSGFNEAVKRIPPITSIINDDMDPKNVMWENGKPHIIDLECLEYGSPFASCINLSLQWAGTAEERFDDEHLRAFFEGYTNAFDPCGISYSGLFGTAYSWLGWLEYNLRRALGLEGKGEAEKEAGRSEVRSTIRRIAYLNRHEDCIRGILKDIDIRNRQ